VMGIINPLLAILPLIEEGKGKDSNCGELIAQATKSGKQKPSATAQSAEADSKRPARSKPSAASGATAPQPPEK
jgi:hypothetical protein